MMQPDMLLLAERLVIAMETISQDVKNMSSYIYDLDVNVSCLLNDKRKKECMSGETYDEGDDPSPVTSVAGQEASIEKQECGECEQTEERSWHVGYPEHVESSSGDIAPASINPHENADILSSESNPFFTVGIKLEERAEIGESDESRDMHDMHENSTSNVTISKEMELETQSDNGREYQANDLHPTMSPPMQLRPSASVVAMECASEPVQREIQSVESPSNSAINSDHTTFLSRHSERQTSVARNRQMEVSEDTSIVHPSLHSEQRSYKCSICEKSFKARWYLEKHTRLHSGDSPHKCSVCGKIFTLNSALITHMRLHTGVRPYSCNVCGKAFAGNSNLIRHMRSHTGERPYKCNVCGSAFSMRQNLIHHMRTHTGEAPYRCNVCGTAFKRNSHLSVHMRSHTRETPYKCDLCGKAFRHHCSLNRHMHTHSGEHPN